MSDEPPPTGSTADGAALARTPLHDDDVERMVPGSEIDAEGAIDRREDAVEAEAPVRRDPAGAEPHQGVAGGATPADTLAAVPERRGSAGAVVGGLFAGAVAGAVAGAIVTYALTGGTAGEQAGKNAESQVAQLSSRVDALDKRPDPDAASLADLKGSVAALQAKVAAATKTADDAKAAAARRPAAAPAAAAPASAGGNQSTQTHEAAGTPPQPVVDAAALQRKVASLQSGLDAVTKQSDAMGKETDALKQQTAALQAKNAQLGTQVAAADDLKTQLGGLAATVAGVQKQAATQQTGLDGVQAEQKSLADKVTAPAVAVIADSLVQQVLAGRPYATQLDAAASLGADSAKVAALRDTAAKGVPSAATLAAQLAPLVVPMIASDHRAPNGAGFGERLKSGLFGLVNVRRADVVDGTDIRSRLARLQADLDGGDLAAALAEYEALPADAKARSAAWGAKLKTSAEAAATAKSLQQTAIASLAGKKG